MDRTDQALSNVREFIEKRDFARRPDPAGEDPGVRARRRTPIRCAARSTCSSRKGASTAIRGAEPSYDSRRRPIGRSCRPPRTRRRTAGGGELLSAALDYVLDHTNPLEVIEVRLATEPVMARLAALRALTVGDQTPADAGGENRARRARRIPTNAPMRCFTVPLPKRRAIRCFSRSSTPCGRASATPAGGGLGENAHCFKRQSVYAGFHESIAAAIAARNGQEAYAQMQRHLRRCAPVHP